MSTPDMHAQLYDLADDGELVLRLAERIAKDLSQALMERGVATLALSGGSTPIPLFDRLSRLPLDWSKIYITQVDERWVEEDHQDSNARLIRQHLLRDAAAEANFVSMKTPGQSPFVAEQEASLKLTDFAGGIDVVVLGMGEDGHTASFFPGAETLSRAMDREGDEFCVAVRPPGAPHERMTLSLAALLRAHHIYLHITGDLKWQVLQRAAQAGSEAELPIRSFLFNVHPPLQIFHASRS